MELTPREKDKLLIFMVALLADRRMAAQGVADEFEVLVLSFFQKLSQNGPRS